MTFVPILAQNEEKLLWNKIEYQQKSESINKNLITNLQP